MERKSRRITNRASGVAAVVSFFTQPIPAADELLVVGIHYYLVVRLARSRGVSVLKLPWRSLQRIVWYGAGARLVANFSIGLVPIVGMFSNAITAVALTEFLARWLDEYILHPETPPPEVTMAGLKDLFASRKARHRDHQRAASDDGATADRERAS
ncbi:MAG TPA: hypothetical protein VGL81_22305 [Polyangiaceae bacterium]|jgi:uncharacterized protein (DUF697 family)